MLNIVPIISCCLRMKDLGGFTGWLGLVWKSTRLMTRHLDLYRGGVEQPLDQRRPSGWIPRAHARQRILCAVQSRLRIPGIHLPGGHNQHSLRTYRLPGLDSPWATHRHRVPGHWRHWRLQRRCGLRFRTWRCIDRLRRHDFLLNVKDLGGFCGVDCGTCASAWSTSRPG